MTEFARRFPLGDLYATPNASRAIAACGKSAAEYLLRHVSGDWGDSRSDIDNRLNDEGIAGGDRIFSAYDLPGGTRIWIITERDRSRTTILLPEDY